MRISLSKYWKKNVIFIIIIALVISTVLLLAIMNSNLTEPTIPVLLVSLYDLIVLCMVFSVRRLLGYICIKTNMIIQIQSFFSSSKKTVYLDKPIFFKKLQLIEGAFSIKQFIIISNESISDEMFFNENRLGVICKIIEDKPHIIICPHDENIMRALTFYTN